MYSTTKIIISLFCTAICINSFVNCAVFTEQAAKHPAYPGKCFDKITRRAMIPNKEYKPKGICAVMVCNIENYTIDIETCPSIEMPGCIEIPIESAKPFYSYPKCCPQFLCTDHITGEQFVMDATSF